MSGSNQLKWLSIALVFLLAACSGVGSGAAEGPAAEAAQQVTFVEELENPVEAAQPVAEEVEPQTFVEKIQPEAVAKTNPAVESETVDAGAQAGEESSAPDEAVVQTETAATEAPAAEEEMMSAEARLAEPGPSPEQRQLLASLNVLGQPPELFNEVWLNSEPLKLADLRGKVVIVEFWTFG